MAPQICSKNIAVGFYRNYKLKVFFTCFFPLKKVSLWECGKTGGFSKGMWKTRQSFPHSWYFHKPGVRIYKLDIKPSTL